jgi:predicted nucleotidyltransferase
MKTLEHTPLLPYEQRAITEAVSLLTKQFPIEHVILFGSKARGDDDEFSDFDPNEVSEIIEQSAKFVKKIEQLVSIETNTKS